MVYKWYILPITYHLLREPETTIDVCADLCWPQNMSTWRNVVSPPWVSPTGMTSSNDETTRIWKHILKKNGAIYCKYSFRLKTKQRNLATRREFQTNHPKSTPKTRTEPPQKKTKKHEKHLPPALFSMEMCRFISSSLLHREPKVCSKVVVAPGDDMTISSHGSKSTKGGTDLLHII